jgi:hypothetical protein
MDHPPLIKLITLTEQCYREIVDKVVSSQRKWTLFVECSSFTNFENNPRLLVFHELFFRIVIECGELNLDYETASHIVNIFHEQLSVLANTRSSENKLLTCQRYEKQVPVLLHIVACLLHRVTTDCILPYSHRSVICSTLGGSDLRRVCGCRNCIVTSFYRYMKLFCIYYPKNTPK